MFPDLDAPYCSKVHAEANGYRLLYEPVDKRLPDSPDDATLERLHGLALDSDPKAVAELRKHIKLHPGCPTLKNYLSAAHKIRGEAKKAARIDEQLWHDHPDYLFARVGKANNLIQSGRHDEARAILGESLRLSDACPGSEAFHVSEWKSFYQSAGLCHIGAGEFEKAQAILKALSENQYSEEEANILQQAIMLKRMEQFRERTRRAEETAIRVRTEPLPRKPTTRQAPKFHHPEIQALYQNDIGIPEELVTKILALPRNTLVSDLCAVLRDAIARGPEFYRHESHYDSSELCFPLHALFLLSELQASEALDDTLAFLSIHEKLNYFWLGELIGWQPVYGIIDRRLADTLAWMRTPGIPESGKNMVADVAVVVAQQQPERHDEVIGWFREVLEFLRDSDPRDNVLDTQLVSGLVCDLVDLRATGLTGLISDLYEKRYVSEFMAGDLESVLEDIDSSQPSGTPGKPSRMLEFYQSLLASHEPAPPEPLDLQEQDYHSLYSTAKIVAPAPAERIGRNDPCPCGSGRKYKKCCLGKAG